MILKFVKDKTVYVKWFYHFSDMQIYWDWFLKVTSFLKQD